MKIGQVADVTMIVAAVAITTCAVAGLHKTSPARPSALPYKSGERIKDNKQLDFFSAPLTLLIVTRSSCVFCEASIPLLRRVTEAAKRAGTKTVGIAVEDSEVNRSYLSSRGIHVDAVADRQESGVRVMGTPDLVLVNRQGIVVNSWHGFLAPNREVEVVKAVGGQ